MNTNRKSVIRWPLLMSYLGVIALLLACATLTVGSTSDPDTQIDDRVVQVKNENGDWMPVAGDATFELVGSLENMDPWTVAGKTFETNESTQIAEGLETGDLVRVRGAVLEDGTWVAYSIEPAVEQTDPVIVLIGTVDSVDPWMVNGIDLNVTDTTEIKGDITPGTIVRVEILLLEDGTWEVISIAALGNSTEIPGCITVIATVVSVSGNQIQFLGWPTTVVIQLNSDDENDQNNENEQGDEDQDDDEDEEGESDNDAGTNAGVNVSTGQMVWAVVCVSDNKNLVIVNIFVLNIEDNDGDEGEGGNPSTGGEKVLVCHKPNHKKGGHTISISSSAVPAHLGHGDILGPCP